MSPITRRDFQSALPLPASVLANLEPNFAAGWVDAVKIHHQSAAFRIKVNDAKERIATNLGLAPDEIEIVGEIGFGFWSALAGLLAEPCEFTYSAIDRQLVHAFARSNQERGGANQILAPSQDGLVDYNRARPDSVLVWQGTNREMGVEQRAPSGASNRIFADMTARFDPRSLPPNWDVALWDARNFAGPEGIAILGIRSGSRWRSPIPQIDGRRLFGSYSKPLLIAAADALELWNKRSNENRAHLEVLNLSLRRQIAQQIPTLQVVGDRANSDPRFIALVANDLIAEEALRELERIGILIDAGSACNAAALTPSHVLAALGFGSDGHLRVTLKAEHSEDDIAALVAGLTQVITRSN